MHKRRLKAAQAARKAVSDGSAPTGPLLIGWDELLARAEGELDEQGFEKVAKWKAVAEKQRRMMEARGQKEFVDVGAMQRALCAYWSDVTGDGPMVGFKRVFAENGAKAGDFFGGGESRFPDLRVVYEYICRLMKRIARSEAEESVGIAQGAQKKLITEEGCGLNQRAVEVSLKATMRDVYGEEADRGESSRRGGITYNIPNLTVNMITAPAAVAGRQIGSKPSVEIEAEVVSDG